MSALRNLASGARNQKAFKNLIGYYDKYDERPDKVGQGNAKPPQIELYVHPFGQKFKAELYLKVRGTSSAWTNHNGKLLTRTKVSGETFPAATDIILLGGRTRPAKIVITTGLSTNGVRKVSARTKLPYLSYGGTSGSLPFGAASNEDSELAAYNAIVNNFKEAGKIPPGMRLSRIKEKI